MFRYANFFLCVIGRRCNTLLKGILILAVFTTPVFAQAIDPNKPVTLTYGELTQYIGAEMAAARAADAQERVKAINDKINAQIIPPKSPAPDKK